MMDGDDLPARRGTSVWFRGAVFANRLPRKSSESPSL